MQISEIFGPTVQGEGLKKGTPSIFIRFAKCNLRCRGFGVAYGDGKVGCDSWYAVDAKQCSQTWKDYSHSDIIKRVEQLIEPLNYKPEIVITGGEPLLNWNNEAFQSLLNYLIEDGFDITIETNATLSINFTQPYQKKILFSMSVKLSNSLEPYNKRVNLPAINSIIDNANNAYFKFVIDAKNINQLEKEIIEILSQTNKKIPIKVMPLGITNEELNPNAQSAIKLALKHNFRYSDRIHIRIWGDIREV